MLNDIRVLDLSDNGALLGAQMLADLGADVIVVEPLEGSTARRIGPFLGDAPHPERSLFWWAYGRNKRSVALDLKSDDGRAVFFRLARSADVIIESRPGSPLPDLDLDVGVMLTLLPGLVHVTVSPYGLSGPKKDYASSDLTLLAAGGVLALTGDEDRPPTRLCVPQAHLHAGADAAVGALIALHERRRSGLGQHVDVAIQQSVAMATQSYVLATANHGSQINRMAGGFNLGALRIPAVWRVLDGYVSLTVLFGQGFAPFTSRLVEYLCEQGACDPSLLNEDWITYGRRLLEGTEPIAHYEALLATVGDFIATRTKAELFHEAISRRLLLAPIATVADVLASPHLLARGYWVNMEYPDLKISVPYPGPFAKFARSPITYRLRPPSIGEHTSEVLGEVGLNSEQISGLASRGIIAA